MLRVRVHREGHSIVAQTFPTAHKIGEVGLPDHLPSRNSERHPADRLAVVRVEQTDLSLVDIGIGHPVEHVGLTVAHLTHSGVIPSEIDDVRDKRRSGHRPARNIVCRHGWKCTTPDVLGKSGRVIGTRPNVLAVDYVAYVAVEIGCHVSTTGNLSFTID